MPKICAVPVTIERVGPKTHGSDPTQHFPTMQEVFATSDTWSLTIKLVGLARRKSSVPIHQIHEFIKLNYSSLLLCFWIFLELLSYFAMKNL